MARAISSRKALKFSWKYAASRSARKAVDCHIAVIGVGRAGSNTVTRLMESGSTSAECIVINTDAAHLNASKAHQKILIGEKSTGGFGVNGDPKLGKTAIEESRRHIEDICTKIDIAFITAGLGGGTGTGAAPVVADIAKRKGAVTVGVVTMPFRTEKGRDKYASASLAEMRRYCDTVVVIDNDRLMQVVPQLTVVEAFGAADQVLASMIKGITETIASPSLINLDFADFKTIIRKGGIAAVGFGESDAPNRAEEAARNALRTPLWDADYTGATGALVHVTGDNHMTVEEANRVGEIVVEMMDVDATVAWGARVNPEQEGKLKVTLVMTGVNSMHTQTRFATIAPQLFNLEPYAKPERPIGIKLDLYQMDSDA